MKKFVLILFILFSVQSIILAQLPPYSANHKESGKAFAGTSVKDTKAPGGFSSSSKVPVSGAYTFQSKPKGIQLRLVKSETAVYAGKYAGHELYLLNRTESTVGLPAQDSRLNLIAEVLVDGEWKAIEKMPNSWCGNSYHTVYFRPNEYWKFVMPVYSGTIETQLRYKLIYAYSHKAGMEKAIYSNIIDVKINPEQLSEK